MTLVFVFIASVVGFALAVDRMVGNDDTDAVNEEFWAMVGAWDE